MVKPLGLARDWNWLAPLVEPPPGMFLTAITGPPGRLPAIWGA